MLLQPGLGVEGVVADVALPLPPHLLRPRVLVQLVGAQQLDQLEAPAALVAHERLLVTVGRGHVLAERDGVLVALAALLAHVGGVLVDVLLVVPRDHLLPAHVARAQRLLAGLHVVLGAVLDR